MSQPNQLRLKMEIFNLLILKFQIQKIKTAIKNFLKKIKALKKQIYQLFNKKYLNNPVLNKSNFAMKIQQKNLQAQKIIIHWY